MAKKPARRKRSKLVMSLPPGTTKKDVAALKKKMLGTAVEVLKPENPNAVVITVWA